MRPSTEVADDDRVAAVVLAAKGPVFSAGHDLKELSAHRADADSGLAFFESAMARCSDMMQAIVACPKPVIAAVQGMATAAGCQLVATCDLAVAAEGAQFCTPGVNIGLFCSTPMVALSRNVPRKRAMEMLLLGEMLPARRPPSTASSIASCRRSGCMDGGAGAGGQDRGEIAGDRRHRQGGVLRADRDAAWPRPMPTPPRSWSQNMMARDAEEGIGAFLEKRKPEWKGC